MHPSLDLQDSRLVVESGDIRVGVPLQCNVYDKQRRLLLRQGHVLTSQGQVEALLRRGAYFIRNSEDASLAKPTEPVPQMSVFELIDMVYMRLESLLQLGEGKIPACLDAGIGRICRLIQAACQKDPGAALSTLLLQNEGKYSIKHQIHTAVACETVLSTMGYAPQHRFSVLAASLTMNIAINHLQDILFYQKESLTREQNKSIQSHLFEGIEILHRCGISDQLWLDTVLQHHEFLNGQGYPQRLQGSAIMEPSRVLTIADIYCAKVTGRAYRKPLMPNVALKEIFRNDRGQCVDVGLSQIFIRELGIYPPGSLVRLTNGDIAVVIRAGEKANCPVVSSIVRSTGKSYLNPRRRDTEDKEFAVLQVLEPSEYRVFINRDRLWCEES